MKKIMTFAIVQAIALAVALNFGLVWVYFGIGVCFIAEYCAFTEYKYSTKKNEYAERVSLSRKWMSAHLVWFASTIVLAAIFGVLGGYDYTAEISGCGTYEYENVHVDGVYWWVLSIFLIARFLLQYVIERELEKNIELARE